MSSKESDNDLIKINFENFEEIQKLHGIGPVLAARIVDFRTKNGPFMSPSDLEAVPGMSALLVDTLIPKIDWSAPDQKTDTKEIEWVLFLFFSFLSYVVFLWFSRGLIFFLDFVAAYEKNDIPAIVVATTVFEPVALLPLLIGLLLMAMSCLARTEQIEKKLFRASMKLTVISFGLTAIKGVFWAVRYSTLDGWGGLLSSPANIRAIQMFWASSWVIIPTAALLINWRLAGSIVMERIYNLGMVISSFSLIAYALYWQTDAVLGPVEIVARVLHAILGMWAGILIIRGDSPFKAISRYFGFNSEVKPKYLEIWLERSIPSKEAQIELRDILNKKHPRSIRRTFFGAVLLSSSGWLLLTVLGAVIEWALGDLLDHVFG